MTGAAPEFVRGRPLVGYAFIAAVPVPRQRLSSGPAQAALRHDLAEQVDHLGVVGFAKLQVTGYRVVGERERGTEVRSQQRPSVPRSPAHHPLFARRPSFAWRVCCPRFGARKSAPNQIAPDGRDPSRATRLVKDRVMDKNRALHRHDPDWSRIRVSMRRNRP